MVSLDFKIVKYKNTYRYYAIHFIKNCGQKKNFYRTSFTCNQIMCKSYYNVILSDPIIIHF